MTSVPAPAGHGFPPGSPDGGRRAAMNGQEQEPWMSVRPQGLEPDDTEWPPTVDTTVAHSARRYDYWLGGKDNFAADRESGDAIAAAFPTVRTAVIENRRFVRRAVAFLAGHAGSQQFL